MIVQAEGAIYLSAEGAPLKLIYLNQFGGSFETANLG